MSLIMGSVQTTQDLERTSAGRNLYYWMQTRRTNFPSTSGGNSDQYYVGGHPSGGDFLSRPMAMNSMICVPFACHKNIKVDTMCCNINFAGSATTQIQLGIYTNSADEVLFPYEAVSTSNHITGTNTGIHGFNPVITLSAGNLYWFVYLSIRSTANLKVIAGLESFPIFGTDSALGTASMSNAIRIAWTTTLPTLAPGSGQISNLTNPVLAIRVSA